MFNLKHYVPILKWKAAEQIALQELKSESKKNVIPLIQVIMPAPKTPKEGEREKTPSEQIEEVTSAFRAKLLKIPEEIQKFWGDSPVYVDPGLILTPNLRLEALTKVLEIGQSLRLFLIPVVNLGSGDDIRILAAELAKKYGHGVCLKLTPADFAENSTLNSRIKQFLTDCSLTEKDVDLLIDIQDRNDHYKRIFTLSQGITSLQSWRTFIFASGAFPVDLSECNLGENYQPRVDWNNWVDAIKTQSLRHPSFSDYTIQHPIYKESIRFFAPSASIRYTLEPDWLILRGLKGKPAHYLASAQLLSQSQEFKDKFRGADFSFGDAFIAKKGEDLNSDKTGNPMNWLSAGINHHLETVVFQLANLP